jgi:hypothetical protein
MLATLRGKRVGYEAGSADVCISLALTYTRALSGPVTEKDTNI